MERQLQLFENDKYNSHASGLLGKAIGKIIRYVFQLLLNVNNVSFLGFLGLFKLPRLRMILWIQISSVRRMEMNF